MRVVDKVATQGCAERSVGAHGMVYVGIFLVSEVVIFWGEMQHKMGLSWVSQVVGFRCDHFREWGGKVSSLLRFSSRFLSMDDSREVIHQEKLSSLYF